MQVKDIDNILYKNSGNTLNTDFEIDFERVHFLEDEFQRLPKGSVEREQNIQERLKLLGVNIN